MNSSVFSKIKEQLNIIDSIRAHTSLYSNKAGTLYWGSCPLCKGTHDGFKVEPVKQIFYCFSCHKGGDMISFEETISNCSAKQAIENLIERHNLDADKIYGSKDN